MAETTSRGNVLIIEDQPETVRMISDLLVTAGYEVFVAMTGEKGLERAAVAAADVILLDIMLPGLDGYDVCRQFKAQPETAAIPVIFLSALGATFDKVKAFQAGGADYLVKPLVAEELLARVQNQIAPYRLRRDLEGANRRLESHVARLAALNKELQDFAYVVSHDLKAPLRAISRLVQWLVEDYRPAFDGKGKEMADLLVGRVKRMDALIDGILEYSRIGRIDAERLRVDLNELVADVVDTLAPPPHIQAHIVNVLPTVVADKTRLVQVFQNLIGNAIKFIDKPQGEIAVGCADDGSFWRLSVTDNGPGIDPKHHDRIFQIFQTLHPRDEVESTGIGLAIVKKIVELYGGTVGVESAVGQGSTFWFTLPKAR